MSPLVSPRIQNRWQGNRELHIRSISPTSLPRVPQVVVLTCGLFVRMVRSLSG